MAGIATQALGGPRNDKMCAIPIIVPGLDLTGLVVRAQIRMSPDNPVLLLDLQPTTDPAITGIRMLASTADGGGVPTSHFVFQVAKADMQALPYAGEMGDPWIGAYGLQIDGIERLRGPFVALASAIDSNTAPANRPASVGGVYGGAVATGITLTIGDSGVSVSINGADLIAPLVAQASASAQSAAAAAASAVAAGFYLPLTLGRYTGTGASVTNGPPAFSSGPRFLQRAMLVGAKFNTASAGMVGIARAAPTFDGGDHINVGYFGLEVSAGVVSITQADILAANGGKPLIFEADERLAFVGSNIFKYTASAEPYVSFPAGLNLVPSATMLNSSAAGASFDAEWYFLLAAPTDATRDATFERYDRFGSLPIDWYNIGGGAALDLGGAILLSGAAFGKQLSTQRSFGLDQRSIVQDFQFASDDARLLFTTNPTLPTDSGQFEGSAFRIDRDTGKLMVYSRWDGSSGEPSIDLADQILLTNLDGSPFVLATGHTYTLLVDKLTRDYRISLIDPTGPSYFSHTVSDGGVNTYTAALGAHTKHGLLHGSVSFGTTQGAARLMSYRMTAPYDCEGAVLVLGDSKTEGFTLAAAQRYAQLLANRYRSRRVAISGVGGATSVGGLNRILVELDGLRPAHVVINLGTNAENDATFATNVALIVQIARNAGAQVHVCTIASSSTKTAAIKALSGIGIVDFAAAMTTTGAGSARVATLYAGTRPDDGQAFNDGLHENAIGAAREDAQMVRDARL